MNEALVTAMADLEEDDLFELVRADVDAGRPAVDIIADLQKGLDIVGERFSSKEYFLSELIMSADIFNECQEIIGVVEDEEDDDKEYIGRFMIGTVATDIHDIGKNIVTSIMKSNGFKVYDLGVDVPIETFLAEIRDKDPQIIGLSCLLTTSFDSLRDTVTAIREAGLDEGRLIIVGGGPVEESTREYAGADKYSESAQMNVDLAKEFLGVA